MTARLQLLPQTLRKLRSLVPLPPLRAHRRNDVDRKSEPVKRPLQTGIHDGMSLVIQDLHAGSP